MNWQTQEMKNHWKTVFENGSWWIGHKKGTDLHVSVMDKRR